MEILSESPKSWPEKAIDSAFWWNTQGNYIGWGTLLCLLSARLGGFGYLVSYFGLMNGILILPIVISSLLLLNLLVGLALVVAWVQNKGRLPALTQSRSYFIKGAISTFLFFLGCALYVTLYYILTNAAANSPD
jgi:hypothetical protein